MAYLSHHIVYGKRANKWLLLAAVNVFIILFFGLFDPFYMSHYTPAVKWSVIGGYMLISAVALLVCFFLWPRQIYHLSRRFENTMINQAAWIGIHVLIITSLCFCFKIAFGFYELSWARIGTGIGAALIVGGLFFIVLTGSRPFWKKVRAAVQKTQVSPIILTDYQQRHAISIPLDSILYLENEKNEVMLHYIVDGEGQTFTFRKTMRDLEQELKAYPQLKRCHRAFIVNTRHFNRLKKEGHRYFLYNDADACVPVSRSLAASILG